VQTPVFDGVAEEGVLFTHCYCSAPSCTPSRGAVLTGRNFWELDEGALLWSTLSTRFAVYPDLLAQAGYHVGLMKKGWGPGDHTVGGWTRNPAGPGFKSFAEFLQARLQGQPFCFWFGSFDPHRPYEPGSGIARGMDPSDVRLPPFLPDAPEVRSDICDYYFEIERYDRDIGEMLALLEERGELDNTLVVITSDNGMPFPRAKTNLYDFGTRMPLAVRWPERVPAGRRVTDFISHIDLAPTFLEACGVEPLEGMSGRSFLDVLTSTREGRLASWPRSTSRGLPACSPDGTLLPRRGHRQKKAHCLAGFPFVLIVEVKTNLVVEAEPDLTDHVVDTNMVQFARRLLCTYLEYCPCRCGNMQYEKLSLSKVGQIVRWRLFHTYCTTAVRVTAPLVARKAHPYLLRCLQRR
jgi:hypothetical protein